MRFAATGNEVTEVKVVLDRDTGRPRGFAFVEMSTDAGAAAAIETLNGKDLQGRAIRGQRGARALGRRRRWWWWPRRLRRRRTRR